jgi:hypothetical protein
MNDDPQIRLPTDVYQARQWIAGLSVQLAAQGIGMREPPEEPTSCCGRGCNGCVWEGYMSAVAYWCEQARAALLKEQDLEDGLG